MNAILAKKTIEPKREVSPAGFLLWYIDKVQSPNYITPDMYDRIQERMLNSNPL